MKHYIQLIGSRAKFLIAPVTSLGCKAEVIDKPEQLNSQADICLAWGVFNIIKSQYLNVPRLGLWGFHESALPKGRGCSPTHWAVLNNEQRLTVSFFKLVDKIDAGPLIDQVEFPIASTDLLEDLRAKAVVVVQDMIMRNLVPFLEGKIKPRDQKGDPTFYPKRTIQDSRLDMEKSLRDLWGLIRVCDNDDYPAWFEMDGKKFVLKRYKG